MGAAEQRLVVNCEHCGLPVPPGLVVPHAPQQFCCTGCGVVYATLHEHGLQSYYRLLDRSAEAQPARVTGRSYGELDDSAFQQRYCQQLPSGHVQVELYVEGVYCTACIWVLEALPRRVAGLIDVRVELGRSLATITWQPARTGLSCIARLLDSLGYPVHPYRGVDRARLRRLEDRRLLMRMGVAGAAAGNTMLMAFALYAGVFGDMAERHVQLFRWASLLIALPAVLWAGTVFFRGALAALRARRLHMDLPISIGIAAGAGWGLYSTVHGRGEIYFDSITLLVFLLLVGRWLQQRQHRRAADASEMLFALTPAVARLVEGDSVREVALEALGPGAVVEVRAGESIPVDGTIADGQSTVDVSLLTGESRPARVGIGDAVHAGTLNLGSRLQLAVTATGEQTRVGQLMRRIEEHARRRAPIVQLADRIAGWFVAATLALAATTAVLWLDTDPRLAVEHALALLIVTCPCALGLATPLAVSIAIGRAAQQSILVKGGDAVERLARPGTLLLDKTGTVTQGRLALVHWEGDRAVQPLVAALEAHSAHHLARAFVAALGAGAEPALAQQVHESPGGGIAGYVAGRRLLVGSTRYVEQQLGALPGWVPAYVARWGDEALSPVLVACDGAVVAAAAFGDPLRPDAAATLAQLRRRGWRLALLSGDHPRVVEAVGRQLGIAPQQCEGGAAPEHKLARVQEYLEQGPVVMVGDGVNDAAALAAATAGVAVHGGAEASLAVADVFIGRPGLAALAELLDGARSTLRVIRRNLGFSLAYNCVGAGLAMTGVLDPLMAAVLMPLSSLTVLASSMRARTFGAALSGVDARRASLAPALAATARR